MCSFICQVCIYTIFDYTLGANDILFSNLIFFLAFYKIFYPIQYLIIWAYLLIYDKKTDISVILVLRIKMDQLSWSNSLWLRQWILSRSYLGWLGSKNFMIFGFSSSNFATMQLMLLLLKKLLYSRLISNISTKISLGKYETSLLLQLLMIFSVLSCKVYSRVLLIFTVATVFVFSFIILLFLRQDFLWFDHFLSFWTYFFKRKNWLGR